MSKQQIANPKTEIRALLEGDAFREQVAKALPTHLTPDRFLRVALTAFNRTPKLYACTRESLFQSMLDLSATGLEPDGRHAHLIPYGNQCQLIIDYKGLLALAKRNGVTADAKVVREADHFEVIEDDGSGNTVINHAVNYRKARGDSFAFYCRATWQEGDNRVVSYEVMTRDEVEAVRARSKAGKSGPWVTDFDEMARKTVMRRHSKRWPLSAEIADAINKDFDTPDFARKANATSSPLFADDDQIAGAEVETEVVQEGDND